MLPVILMHVGLILYPCVCVIPFSVHPLHPASLRPHCDNSSALNYPFTPHYPSPTQLYLPDMLRPPASGISLRVSDLLRPAPGGNSGAFIQ